MDTYITEFDTYNKTFIFDFHTYSGGIGDCIKFFMMFLNICVQSKIKLYYKKNNMRLEKYLQLVHPKMYISPENIHNAITLSSLDNIPHIRPGIHYIALPSLFYATFKYSMLDEIINIIPIQSVFKCNISNIPNVPEKYLGIHLRLGDAFLEINKQRNLGMTDTRKYDEPRIINCIKENADTPILFVCDNDAYRRKIKSEYNNIFITDCEIGHTTLQETTDKQVHDALVEFYLLSKSQIIFAGSNSGFSVMAAKYNNVPIINLYNE